MGERCTTPARVDASQPGLAPSAVTQRSVAAQNRLRRESSAWVGASGSSPHSRLSMRATAIDPSGVWSRRVLSTTATWGGEATGGTNSSNTKPITLPITKPPAEAVKAGNITARTLPFESILTASRLDSR